MFQHITKETFSGSTISTLGDQEIDHVSILIDGSPQVVTLTTDCDKEFVNRPDVPKSSLLPGPRSNIGRAKLHAPEPNRLIRDDDAALGEQAFHIAEAQREPMVEPDGMANDFRWKAMPSIK